MNWSGIIRFVMRYGYWIIITVENAYRFISYRLNPKGMSRIGVFTPEQETLIIEAIGQHVKLKNKLYTRLAKFGVKILIRGVDNFGLDKIQQKWKDELIPLIDAAIKGEKEKVRGLTTDLLNKKIDIKRLDDEQELILFDLITKSVALSIDIFVQKK